MSTSALLLITVAAIVLCVVLNAKTGYNIGLFAMAFAYLIGTVICKGSITALAANSWPIAVLYQMFACQIFFGFANANGALVRLADVMFYPFRKKPIFIVAAYCFVLWAIVAVGANGSLAPLFMLPIMFPVVEKLKMDKWQFYLATYAFLPLGFCAGLSGYHVLITSYAESFVPEMDADMVATLPGKLAIFALVATLIVTVIYMIWWRPWSHFRTMNDQQAGEISEMFSKPEPATAEQKKVYIVLAVIAVLGIIFPALTTITGFNLSSRIDISSLFLIGGLVLAFWNAGDLKKVLDGLPFQMIFMLGGMAMLISLAGEFGLVEFIAGLISKVEVPAAVMVGLVVFFTGTISSVSDGGSVALPLMLPLTMSLSALTGADPRYLVIATVLGNLASGGVCPFSTTGGLAYSCWPAEERKGLIPKMVISTYINIAIWSVVSMLTYALLVH